MENLQAKATIKANRTTIVNLHLLWNEFTKLDKKVNFSDNTYLEVIGKIKEHIEECQMAIQEAESNLTE
jgi:hypothetical protein